jgi:hypothetical protein
MKPFNWPGVIASILVANVLTFFWYGALFGERWNILMGRDPLAPVISADNTEMAFAVMATSFWVGGIGWLCSRFAADSYWSGARIGGAAWLLFAAPLQSFTITFQGHDRGLAVIDMGYTLVAFTLVGALIGGLTLRGRDAATTG